MKTVPNLASLAPLAAVIGAAVFGATPALGQAGTAVPEPSNLALFGIGIAGLVIGRQVAKRRADSEE